MKLLFPQSTPKECKRNPLFFFFYFPMFYSFISLCFQGKTFLCHWLRSWQSPQFSYSVFRYQTVKPSQSTGFNQKLGIQPKILFNPFSLCSEKDFPFLEGGGSGFLSLFSSFLLAHLAKSGGWGERQKRQTSFLGC